MSNNKLKIGVLGCGNVAKIGHLPWYHRSPLAEVIAIADPWERNRNKMKKKYNVPKAYENSDELLDDPEIDAVSICTPHWLHAEQAIKAAKKGKHILCEKPIGLTLEEIDEVIKAVEENKIIFQTATQKRFHNAFQTIKGYIQEDKLGKIFHANIYWYHYIPDLNSKKLRKGINFFKKLGIDFERIMGAWRLTDERGGGGDMMDHAPHYIDLLRWWFGDIKTISAKVSRVFESRVHEDHGAVLITFKENDIIAVFERSQNFIGRPKGEELGRIHGTKMNVYFDVPHEYNLSPITLKKYSPLNIIRNKPKEVKIKFPKDEWNLPYARSVRSFINQVLGKSNEDVGFPEEWIPTIYDGRAALEGVLAIYESSRTEQTINLPLKSYTPINWVREYKVD